MKQLLGLNLLLLSLFSFGFVVQESHEPHCHDGHPSTCTIQNVTTQLPTFNVGSRKTDISDDDAILMLRDEIDGEPLPQGQESVLNKYAKHFDVNPEDIINRVEELDALKQDVNFATISAGF